MNHPNKYAYALAALSGLLLAGSFAPLGYWPLAWAALVPLFYVLPGSAGFMAAARLGAVTGLVFYTAALSWMPNVVDYLAVVFWLVFAFWTALHAGLMRGLFELAEKRGLTPARALLWAAAAGAVWAGLEYFRSEVWPLRCPWLGLGYSQTYNPPVFQSLSVWGVYGLSAFIAAANAAWALALRRARLPAAVFLILLALMTAWGRHRLNTVPAENGTPITAALVQAERSDINKLVRFSLAPEAAAADLLVWPELAVMMPGPGQAAYTAMLAKKLKPSKAVAVLGAGADADPARRAPRQNFTLILDRNKRPVGRYDKLHPVQFVEAGLPSNKNPLPVATELGKLGPQICYDLAFEDGTRKITRAGAQLLIVPTLDPVEWGPLQHEQHSDMSAARAVESGLWLVRAASSGTSQIIDRLGGLRASLKMGREGALSGTAYIGNGGTFYTRAGWLAGPLCLIFTLAAGAWTAFRRKQNNTDTEIQ